MKYRKKEGKKFCIKIGGKLYSIETSVAKQKCEEEFLKQNSKHKTLVKKAKEFLKSVFDCILHKVFCIF